MTICRWLWHQWRKHPRPFSTHLPGVELPLAPLAWLVPALLTEELAVALQRGETPVCHVALRQSLQRRNGFGFFLGFTAECLTSTRAMPAGLLHPTGCVQCLEGTSCPGEGPEVFPLPAFWSGDCHPLSRCEPPGSPAPPGPRSHPQSCWRGEGCGCRQFCDCCIWVSL